MRTLYKAPPLERYAVDPETGCWEWLGNRDNKGYGRCKDPRGRTERAHRLVYMHHIGPIPDGLVLDHLCRNRGCVNPEHLEPVTRGENTRRGAGALLTVEQAAEIREVVDALCDKYGVRPRTLAAIGERQIWKGD